MNDPVLHELALGFLYGLAMTLVLAKPSRCSKWSWSLLVIASGYVALGALASLDCGGRTVNGGQHWSGIWTGDSTLCRAWTLSLLVCLTLVYESVRLRIAGLIQHARQFTIGDLMLIATAFACLVAAARQTTLIQRSPIFWFGMLAIGGVIPPAVVALRFDRRVTSWLGCGMAVAGACLLAVGLAWADSTIVQPRKFDFTEAATRYGCLIAAMMAPRFIEQSIAAASRLGMKRLPLSIVDCDSRPVLVADHLETQTDAHSDTPPMPRACSRRADTPANQQAQPTLELIA